MATTSTLRKILSFFSTKPRKTPCAHRSRSSTPDSLKSRLSSSSSRKPSSAILKRLKSWFERNKGLAPEGFFCVDVGVDSDDDVVAGEVEGRQSLKEKEKKKTKEKVRYVVPISYLTHEALQKLLDDSVAEFGHPSAGALQLVCEEEVLQEVLDTIERSFEGEGASEGEKKRLIAGKHDPKH